ncbi:MAG: hypothetical protein ACRDID_05460, partial [Ktedonobacterales bacterium]
MAVKTATARAANKANHSKQAGASHGVNLDLLRRLSETPGVSGREEQVRAIVVEQLKPLVDELSVDALG